MITFALVCVELYLIERYLERGDRSFYAMPLIVLYEAGIIAARLVVGKDKEVPVDEGAAG